MSLIDPSLPPRGEEFDFEPLCEIKDKEKSALRIASALKKIRS